MYFSVKQTRVKRRHSPW